MNLICKTPYLLILFNIIHSAVRNIQPILQTTEPIPLHHGKTDYDYHHANTPNPESYFLENTAIRLLPERSTTQSSMILNVNNGNTRQAMPSSNYHSRAPKKWHTDRARESRTNRWRTNHGGTERWKTLGSRTDKFRTDVVMSIDHRGGTVTARQPEKSKQPPENSSLQSITNVDDLVTAGPSNIPHTERAPKPITILSTRVTVGAQPEATKETSEDVMKLKSDPGQGARTSVPFVEDPTPDLSVEGYISEPEVSTAMTGEDSRDDIITVLSTIRSTVAPIATRADILIPKTESPVQHTTGPPAQTLLPTKGPVHPTPGTDLLIVKASPSKEAPSTESSTDLPGITEANSGYKVKLTAVTDELDTSDAVTSELKTVEPFTQPGATTTPRTELPVVLEQFSERVVHFGGSVTLVCTGKGSHVRSVSIQRVGMAEDEVHTERGTIEDVKEARLVINPVLLRHAGEYTCTVTDRVGRHTQPLTFIEVVDLCSEVTCNPGTICTADPDHGSTRCERFCPECLAPLHQEGVCGDDCVNYDSVCEIERVNCQFDSMVMPIGRGMCYDLQAQLVDHTQTEFVLDLTTTFELYAEFVNVPESKVIWFKLTDQEEAEMFYEGALYRTDEPGLDLAGRYVAEATSCNGVTLRTPIITVLREEAKEPSNVCSVFGDPNIITFDGYTYTYKGTCHHVLAMDCEQAQWFVYGGFQQTGDHSSEVVSVTVYTRTTSVEFQQGWVVNAMGRKEHLTEGIPSLTGDIELLYNGIYLQASLLSSPNTPTIYWDGISTVHISLPATLSSRTCGLCGNNDRDPTNDIAGSRRGAASTPTEFAASWMLNTRGSTCLILSAASRRHVKKDLKTDACRDMLDSMDIKGCQLSEGEHQFILERCIADTLQNNAPPVSVKCAIGEMYSERCYIKTGVMSSWQHSKACPDKCQYRKIAVEMGCPQNSLPYSDC